MASDRQRIRKAYKRSGLTQREFIRETELRNLRTGKAYHPRTLRKWMSGERSTKAVSPQLHKGGGLYQQTFYDEQGRTFSHNLEVSLQTERLDLFTPKGERERLRTVRRYVKERLLPRDTSSQAWYRQLERKYGKEVAEKYRPIKSAKKLRLGTVQKLRTTPAPTSVLHLEK